MAKAKAESDVDHSLGSRAVDECDWMADMCKEDRWIEMQKLCYQVRVIIDGMTDEINEMFIAKAQAA